MTDKIKFGPAGLGYAKEATNNLNEFYKLGLRACEIAFTYGIYLKKDEAKEIGEYAKKLGIQLSIHAPYFINLNSEDKEKVEKSKKRIIDCLEIGTYLNAKYVVFHAAFYGKFSKEQTYENTKKIILELQKIRKERNYTPKLAPETTGKINVFGSAEEIARLVRDTRCHACIDFAHIFARSNGDYKFQETLKLFDELDEFHLHFSGIEYNKNGEKSHKKTSKEEWKKLINAFPKNKKIVIINESPDMINDSVEGLKLLNENRNIIH